MERVELEQPVSLRRALSIIERFTNRDGEFSDVVVHRKTGIVKLIEKEYLPLYDLAKKGLLVKSIRLTEASNEGPDGEITYWWRFPITVQITCSYENHQRALMREQLANGQGVFINQNYSRDHDGAIRSEGRALVSPSEDKNHRRDRIMEAIRLKNHNFHIGTNTLLVLEERANFKHLRCLHKEVQRAIYSEIHSNYKRIYIAYGEDVQRAV